MPAPASVSTPAAPTRAIIIAAGMGRRLSPYTDDRPKCLVEIAGRSMLHRQIDLYRSVGVTDIVIIRGYRAAQLGEAFADEPGVRFVENRDFERNNILLSLMCASREMDTGFYCSYGDIVYRPAVLQKLAATPCDLGLVVDPFWAETYEGRDAHPIGEAELAAVEKGDGDGRVTRVGKKAVPIEAARGEFIGLWRCSPSGADWLRAQFQLRLQQIGLDGPYGRAPRLQVAYLTDLFNDLIDQGRPVSAVEIESPRSWREIDTVQDFERAAHVVTW